MKTLISILFALPLLSLAPVPAAPTIYHMSVAIVQTAMQPACTWETAPARLRQEITDTAGVPFGFVTAWSCSGDAQAVIAELESRSSALREQAAAYRAAHPIAGMP